MGNGYFWLKSGHLFRIFGKILNSLGKKLLVAYRTPWLREGIQLYTYTLCSCTRFQFKFSCIHNLTLSLLYHGFPIINFLIGKAVFVTPIPFYFNIPQFIATQRTSHQLNHVTSK